MSTLRPGARGGEVEKVQRRLARLRYYEGPFDGAFGPGTRAAVESFQRARSLDVDGIVGPATREALFGRIASPARRPLAWRCLALTGAFETGLAPPGCFSAVAGDFDGQGLSFGALQWNFGQETLTALLASLSARYPRLVARAFGARYHELRRALESDHAARMSFARAIQDSATHVVVAEWRAAFAALGATRECQAAQRAQATALFDEARARCGDYGLWSERAVALVFDILAQNGSIAEATDTGIRADFVRLPERLDESAREVEKLRIVARRRATAAAPRWVADVLARKLAIAEGGGAVHGAVFDLARDFGIRLAPAWLSG